MAKKKEVAPGEADKRASQSEDDKALLKLAREGLAHQCDSEDNERNKMKDDLRFCTLDQWPADLRAERENDPNGARPCLTSDEINQYIVQVENDMRHNRPSVKVRPVDDGADVDTAEVFAGLIRHIEDRSNSSVAYVTAGGSAVRIGLGYFRVVTDYVSPRSKDQEPRIVRIPNTFSVYLGPHIMPDGSDARKAWVIEEMPLERFKSEWPKAKYEAVDFEGVGDKPTWRGSETVTVCEYWWIEETKKTLLFLADGSALFADEYDGPEENIVDERDSLDQKVRWVKMSGCEILERGEWLGKYIPIIEVVGKEAYVDGKRIVWGLVRPAKEMLQMKNYWLSAATEKIALSPKTPFVGAKGQFDGLEEEWRKANTENRAYLEYNAIDVNGNAIPRPERVAPAPVEMAIVNMLGMIERDVQKSLGMFKASVGEAESQQSGKAILALQRESDSGTFHFQDNLSLSIQHCGRILVDLIPKVIDTRRVLRILGEDGNSHTVTVDPEAQRGIKGIYNLTVGDFDVTLSTGPSYSTGRQEAATILTELANSAKDPASAAVMRYLAIKNSDFHGSDEMVKALKVLLPPQVQEAIGGEQEPIPPEAMAKIQELGQQVEMMNQAGEKLAQENEALKAGSAEAQAKIAAEAQAADADRDMKERQAEEDRAAKERQAERDAAVKLRIAKINADCEYDKAAMNAENDANIEMVTPAEGGDGQAPMRPMDKLAALHQKGMEQHAQSMDALATGLTQALSNIGAGMQQQTELLREILAATQAQKRTSISGVQRDASGNIVGATVSTSPVGRMQ